MRSLLNCVAPLLLGTQVKRRRPIDQGSRLALPGLVNAKGLARGCEIPAEKVIIGSKGGAKMEFDRITFDPQILGGRACIRGMRIPVSVIVGQIAHGASFEEILAGYPDLERADIQQALEYAAWLAQEQVHVGQ